MLFRTIKIGQDKRVEVSADMSLRDLCRSDAHGFTDDHINQIARLRMGDRAFVNEQIVFRLFENNVTLDGLYNLTTGSQVVVTFNDSQYHHPATIVTTDTITRAALAGGRDISMEVIYWCLLGETWRRANITQKQIVYIGFVRNPSTGN